MGFHLILNLFLSHFLEILTVFYFLSCQNFNLSFKLLSCFGLFLSPTLFFEEFFIGLVLKEAFHSFEDKFFGFFLSADFINFHLFFIDFLFIKSLFSLIVTLGFFLGITNSHFFNFYSFNFILFELFNGLLSFFFLLLKVLDHLVIFGF